LWASPSRRIVVGVGVGEEPAVPPEGTEPCVDGAVPTASSAVLIGVRSAVCALPWAAYVNAPVPIAKASSPAPSVGSDIGDAQRGAHAGPPTIDPTVTELTQPLSLKTYTRQRPFESLSPATVFPDQEKPGISWFEALELVPEAVLPETGWLLGVVVGLLVV